MGKHSIEKREKVSGPSMFDLRLRSAAGQATSMTTRRRRLGAAAGGLLGMAILPLAVAHADEWTITPVDTPAETVTGIYGHGFEGGDTAPPAVEGSIQGNQIFDWTNTTTNQTGEFYGFESYSDDSLGGINTEVYVAPVPSADDSAFGAYSVADYNGTPPVGSVFDTYSFGYGAFTNVYSAVPNGEGGSTVTDTLTTPFGTVVIPTTFDAADGLVADAGGVGIGNGGSMIPVGSQDVTSISGIPPLTVALQGTQDFNFENSAGTLIGTVGTVDTTTTDGVGTYTEAVLVTQDISGTAGNASAADIPAVGSIFNTVQFGGLTNVYSDYVLAGGNHYTDTLYTSFGNYVIPISFDAAKVEDLTNSPLTLTNGLTFDPTTELSFTGINGLPPVDVGVQGGQDFDVLLNGSSAGSITADVTNTLDEFNDSTETILVTSSTDAAIPKGSEFEIVNLGYGYESIYSDIAGATAAQDVVTETLVTPFGNIEMPPSFDVAAQLIGDMFHVIAGGAAIGGI